VAVRCGFPTADAFREALRVCRSAIRAGFNRFFEIADTKARSARS
jgi:hypothetical protein